MMRQVLCRPCVVCKNPSVVEVSNDGLLLWHAGVPIHEALPELDADQRELLISGTHAHCWETIYGGFDE